ncbi:putative C-type lectin domain family 20 member A isoform X2 [Silurus meridionalis]|uniref:putative C-type lectin domain family 20 member A isoform X2 n=1 Tax=Silurus meridionalis TaxID=175797 RepID=UPI001EEB4537|nr:putative C-type lectin domain family 20 member A isoform X2 [Silurus meridionalis]
MKLNLFLVLCFTGFVPISVFIVQTVPHKYKLISSKVSWSVAQNYCSVIYSDLAIILSDTDWLRFNYVAKINYALATFTWVGLYNDIDSWRWSSNDLQLKYANYTHWAIGEPNNLDGKESCGSVNEYGRWIDDDCKNAKHFICYNANYSGPSSFIGCTTLLPWTAAQAYCRQHHTDLASALQSTDSIYIWNIRLGQGNSWIGLYRDTWKWSDGTDAANLHWATGQPNNLAGNENCVSIYNGKLYDDSCTKLYYFFCHTDSPMRGQIMKLQVKSDQSLLDPVVQSLFLEQDIFAKQIKTNIIWDTDYSSKIEETSS